MKLKLSVEGTLQVLALSESVTQKDVEIIRAGISKLLKNGKNRVILEVDDAQTLPDDVIRDIGFLDNIARELSGRVVIVSNSEHLRKKLEVFATPPLVLCYQDRKSAMAAFSPTVPLDERKPKTPPIPAVESKATHSPTSRDDIMLQEKGEMGRIRRELAEYKKENEYLYEQLHRMFESRRFPVGSEALTEKIRALELEVEKLLAPSE